MKGQRSYPVCKSMPQLCAMLGISPAEVLRRVGMGPDFLETGRSVTAREFYAMWDAVYDEVQDESLPLSLGKELANGPFVPAILAFSSSPNIEVGLSRLALFKPLIAPILLQVERVGTNLQITISSNSPDAPMPKRMSRFELVYFAECARRFTGHPIVPLAIGMPDYGSKTDELDAFFGVKSHKAEHARIVLSAEDAERPLVPSAGTMWAGTEIDMGWFSPLREGEESIVVRVSAALGDLLPSGAASADAVCKRLGMSKRSLQRRLKEKGRSFQDLLDETRTKLSMRYLKETDLSIEEISFLLAFRDPNSFYRAFNGWTGMTPTQARNGDQVKQLT